MNKLLIVLLVVCLVSVSAFVKRDAPEEKKTDDDFGKKLNEFGEAISKQLKETFDPEKIKSGLNDVVEQMNKAIEGLKTPAAEKKS